MFHNGRITMRPYDNHDLSWISQQSLRAKGRKALFKVPLHEGEGFRVRAGKVIKVQNDL
jgi:hypothetical protein